MKAQRIDWLDSIRGLAATGVMVCHYFHVALLALLPFLMGQPQYQPVHAEHRTLGETLQFIAALDIPMDTLSNIANYILGYWDLGKMGVALFFLVSGVVIPFSLFRAESPIRNFVISRLFRLYPIYWVSLLVILILGTRSEPSSLFTILANLTMFQKFIGIQDINGVAWTLQIELMFYITCAGLFALNQLKPKKANYMVISTLWVLALGLAAIRMKTGAKTPIAIPLGLSLMYMGYVWRKWLLKEEDLSNLSMIALGGVFLVVNFLICMMGYGQSGWTYFNSYAIALVFFVLFTTVMRMNQPALLHLGKISYSVYLIHPIVGLFAVPALIRLFPSLFLQHQYLIFIPMILGMVCTLALSSLTYAWIEEPMVKLGRRFIRKASPVSTSMPEHDSICSPQLLNN